MRLIKFRGAVISEIREDGTKEFKERGPIWINADLINGVYDHTILMNSNSIRVMETVDEIIKKLRCGE